MPPIKKFHEKIFKRNSYQEVAIDRCIKNVLSKLHIPKVAENSHIQERSYFSIVVPRPVFN